MTRLRTATARRRALAVVLVCLAPVVSGCLGIPDEGPVVETQTEVDPNEELGYYNDPPPPSPGEQPADIVKGFLDAQTAIPVQTNTAKQYLTRAAASSWRPERGTITYADASLPEGSNRVSVELSGANRLDSGGSWRGPVAAEDRLARPSPCSARRGSGGSPTSPTPGWCPRRGSARRSDGSRSTTSTRAPRSWCPSRSSCRGATSSPPRWSTG